MDDRHFDDLAKSLVVAPSRRTVFKVITSGLLGLVGAKEAAARSCSQVGATCRENANCCTELCGPKDSRGRRYCQCPDGLNACRGACIPFDACCSHDDCVALETDCKSGRCDKDSHTCYAIPKADGIRCDDGNACTQTDTCQAGECIGGNPVVCQPLDDCHVAGECDPVTGACSNPDAADGIDCNDNKQCTVGETCLAGVCQGGEPPVCQTSRPCWEAFCHPDEGCVERPKPAGTSCNDGNLCNGEEMCDGNGECVPGTPITCGECLLCNGSTGECVPTNGLGCAGQGNLCYQQFACQDGTCRGIGEKTCPAPDECHKAGTCNPNTGQCVYENVDDGTACAVGNKCLTNATCQAGVCTGTETKTCEATSELCKYSVCDPASGECVTRNLPEGTTDQKGCLVCVCKEDGTCFFPPENVCNQCQTCDDQDNCEPVEPGTTCYIDCRFIGYCSGQGDCLIQDNPAGCEFGDACNDTYCDETTGQCVSTGENNGRPCGLSDVCGLCQDGRCERTICTGECEQCNMDTGLCEPCDQCCDNQCGYAPCTLGGGEPACRPAENVCNDTCYVVPYRLCPGNICCDVESDCCGSATNPKCCFRDDTCCGAGKDDALCCAAGSCCEGVITHTCCEESDFCCIVFGEPVCCKNTETCGVFGCV